MSGDRITQLLIGGHTIPVSHGDRRLRTTKGNRAIWTKHRQPLKCDLPPDCSGSEHDWIHAGTDTELAIREGYAQVQTLR
jgi:hypothetical protein